MARSSHTPYATARRRRSLIAMFLALVCALLVYVTTSSSAGSASSLIPGSSNFQGSVHGARPHAQAEVGSTHSGAPGSSAIKSLGHATLHGPAVAAKLGNETTKTELGRAAWKLFHTTFAQFPDEPSPDQRTALESYIYLFARMYPCGECAAHFQQILAKYPPQVASRSTAAAWGCHVHNEVNKSLGKAEFDCSAIGDFYDCGCAGEDETDNKVS